MDFVKMEGLGNDFIVLDGPLVPDVADVMRWCDRRFGIGADGVLVVSPVDAGRIGMRYWNADGSEAEMCGNGLRCAARLAHDRGWITTQNVLVETAAGDLPAEVSGASVRALVGRPRRGRVSTLEIDGVKLYPVSVGNPHAVVFVADPSTAPVDELGPRIEEDAMFPDGTNVEFVAVTGAHTIEMRIWERGVGETMASGTGATAAAFSAMAEHGVTAPVEVMLPGGRLVIDFIGDEAWMTGPANYAFRGIMSESLSAGS